MRGLLERREHRACVVRQPCDRDGIDVHEHVPNFVRWYKYISEHIDRIAIEQHVCLHGSHKEGITLLEHLLMREDRRITLYSETTGTSVVYHHAVRDDR